MRWLWRWRWGALAPQYPALLFEFAVFAADGAGQDGADALFKCGAVVGAHPAHELKNGVVDVGFVTNEGVDGFEGFECAGFCECYDISGNMASPEGDGDAAAYFDLTVQLGRNGAVKLPVKRYIDYDFGDHGLGSDGAKERERRSAPFHGKFIMSNGYIRVRMVQDWWVRETGIALAWRLSLWD